jgi:hypothetical protein
MSLRHLPRDRRSSPSLPRLCVASAGAARSKFRGYVSEKGTRGRRLRRVATAPVRFHHEEPALSEANGHEEHEGHEAAP